MGNTLRKKSSWHIVLINPENSSYIDQSIKSKKKIKQELPKVASKLEKVKSSCDKRNKKQEKGDLDLDLIGKYVKGIGLIRQLSYKLSIPLMRKLYDGFKIQTYQLHDLIYEQGEIGDNIYICLKGQVDSYVEKRDESIVAAAADASQINEHNQLLQKQLNQQPNYLYAYEEKDIEEMMNNSSVQDRFKLIREEKLDRHVRMMMKERAKNIEEQRRKEQEKIQFDIQRIMNRQKIIQQIIESNKKANTAAISRSILKKSTSNSNQLNLSPSLRVKQSDNLPKLESQNSNTLQNIKSPFLTGAALSSPDAGEENNLLLKRYKWKQSGNRDLSSKKNQEMRSESQSMMNETHFSLSESKTQSLKGSLIFNRLTKLKSQIKIKDQNELSFQNSQQIEQLIEEESDGGDHMKMKNTRSSNGSLRDYESPSHFQLSNGNTNSFLIKNANYNSTNHNDVSEFLGNLNRICEYKPGQMFGGESFKPNTERPSYIIVMSDEVKVATLEKSVFEEVLMIYYADQLQSEINFLKNNGLFNKFDEQELEQILLQLESCNFKKDVIIYKEDDVSDRLYLVKEGEIEVDIDQIVLTEKKFEDCPFINQQLHQKRQKIAIIGPGQLFGESEILKDIKRVTRAKTLSTNNVFYVFDSNQIKFLLENSDLKENLDQARQNKSSWRHQRLKKIQIATKIHQQGVKKMLENSQTQASIEYQSPRRERNQSGSRNNSLSTQLNPIESYQELPYQINSVPNTLIVKSSLNSERRVKTLATQDQILAEPYSYHNQPIAYQPRNQSFSHSRNSLNKFYSFNPQSNLSPQLSAQNSPQPLSPLVKIPQKCERKISLDFYNNYSVRGDYDNNNLKSNLTEKSLSVSSERNNSMTNSSFLQPFKQNSQHNTLQNKFNSYNPDIEESYQTLNPYPYTPTENNMSYLSSESSTNYQSPNLQSQYLSNSLSKKNQQSAANSLIFYGQKQFQYFSPQESDIRNEKRQTNQQQTSDFNAIDTLTPIIRKSKVLDSLSKAFKKQEHNKNESLNRSERKPLKSLFIYENEPLQQLYNNCKYNHKKYSFSTARKSKRSSVTPSSQNNSRLREYSDLENKDRLSIMDNHRQQQTEQKRKLKIKMDTSKQSNSLEQKQYSNHTTLREFVTKNTVVKIGFLKEQANIKINTNIQQKLMEEQTSKYRLRAMKQILESSHEISNLNYLYKHQKFMKYNDQVLHSNNNQYYQPHQQK